MYDVFRSADRRAGAVDVGQRDRSRHAAVPPQRQLRGDHGYEDGSVCTLTYTALGPKTGMGKECIEVFCDGEAYVLDDFKKLTKASDGSVLWQRRGRQGSPRRAEPVGRCDRERRRGRRFRSTSWSKPPRSRCGSKINCTAGPRTRSRSVRCLHIGTAGQKGVVVDPRLAGTTERHKLDLIVQPNEVPGDPTLRPARRCEVRRTDPRDRRRVGGPPHPAAWRGVPLTSAAEPGCISRASTPWNASTASGCRVSGATGSSSRESSVCGRWPACCRRSCGRWRRGCRLLCGGSCPRGSFRSTTPRARGGKRCSMR